MIVMDVMLKIASWNVRGLSSKKVQDVEFVNIVNKFDVLSLVETWTHKDSPIEISGYCNFHVPGKKLKSEAEDLEELSFISKITFKNLYH